VTTVMGQPNVYDPGPSAEAFRRRVCAWALCAVPLAPVLSPPPDAKAAASQSARATVDTPVDAVRLFASDNEKVLDLDLSRGVLVRSWTVPTNSYITGLAAADGGARLFAVCLRHRADRYGDGGRDSARVESRTKARRRRVRAASAVVSLCRWRRCGAHRRFAVCCLSAARHTAAVLSARFGAGC
jgi:hypothetical protein